jgi:hypothetical protein
MVFLRPSRQMLGWYLDYVTTDSFQIPLHSWSRDSDSPGSIPGRVKNFLHVVQTGSGPTQPIKWVPGVLSPRVKRPGREADHSPPPSAEVKNTWIYTSTAPYVLTV